MKKYLKFSLKILMIMNAPFQTLILYFYSYLKPINNKAMLLFWVSKNIYFYYINTSEIPSELSSENFISSHVKITCYLDDTSTPQSFFD